MWVPPVWMLGSSDGSAEIAGVLGAGFVLALFIGTHDRPPEIIQRYKKAFQTGGSLENPEAIIAVAAICADSKEEAEYIASSHTYWKVQAFRHGARDAFFLQMKSWLKENSYRYLIRLIMTKP